MYQQQKNKNIYVKDIGYAKISTWFEMKRGNITNSFATKLRVLQYVCFFHFYKFLSLFLQFYFKLYNRETCGYLLVLLKHEFAFVSCMNTQQHP